MTKDLKTVIVTGASQGIGRAICMSFLSEGYEVIGIARKKEALLAIKAESDNFVPYCMDLANLEEIQGFAEVLAQSSHKKLNKNNKINEVQPSDSFSTLKLKGQLTTLVNNAAQFVSKDFLSTKSEDWDKQFQVNLKAPALLMQLLFPLLKKSKDNGFDCNVINISSSAGTRPVPNMAAYGSLKSAFTHLSQIVALEWAEHGIRVNCIAPGIVDTPIHNVRDQDKSTVDFLNHLQPLKRIGQPEEIAEAVNYLNQSSWTTGSTLCIDGGISLV